MDNQAIAKNGPMSCSSQTWKPVLKSLSNQMSSHTLQPSKPSPAWPQFSKLNDPYMTEAFTNSSHRDTADEGDDDDDSDVSQSGHSSDSEFYCRPSLQSLHCQDRCLKWEQPSDGVRASSYGAATRGNFPCNCADCLGVLDDCYPDDMSDSERGDRHIRDINILDRFKVPFSYDEVAYSSNEHFREIKSTPGLSIDQAS